MAKLFDKPNCIASFYRIKMALVTPVMGIKKKRKTVMVLRFFFIPITGVTNAILMR